LILFLPIGHGFKKIKQLLNWSIIIYRSINKSMEFNNEDILNDRDNHSSAGSNEKPAVYRVANDKNLKEEDLERNLYGNSRNNMKQVREGQPMGGQNFGKNNNTSSANDKNNPSQYAGNTNPYFDRTEPSEEHPENSNFKPEYQDGRPDYSKAQPYAEQTPKPEKVERGNGENDRPHKGGQYQEGTADNDAEPNVPGPNELPDQQKVGEDVDNDEREHIET
jgi:hypothetical protein